MMIYKPFDVVVVPFPFVDSDVQKKRPAVILSNKNFNQDVQHSVMAMITSGRNSLWQNDISITDLSSAGLSKPSIIRMKIFTIDNRLILYSSGILSQKDQNILRKRIKSLFEDVL